MGFCKGQTKKYGVYHWDTFDNRTIRVHETNEMSEAKKYVSDNYNVSADGADRVDIVTKEGAVLHSFSIR